VLTREAFARRCLFVSIVAWTLFAVLGKDVARDGDPAVLATFAHSTENHSTLIAWWLTWLCYPEVLVPIAVGLVIVAWLAPPWRRRILFSIAVLLLCWRGADFFQHVFARARPSDWVVKHEMTFSYPSSHAAIATGFYGLWALMLYRSQPATGARKTGGMLLALGAVAICWSRLALGAHYVTDLIGGALLAVGLVGLGLAIFPVGPFRIAGQVYAGENRAI
jgi:membrane-associated phospholipid phosphatase